MNRKALMLALFWWGLIMLSLPFGRAITNALRDSSALNLALISALGAAIGGILLGLYFLHTKRKIRQRKIRFILVLLLSLILASLFLERPEERWHVYHYGILALFVWEIFAEKSKMPLVFCCLSLTMMGFLEEAAQFFIPERVFDWRDVLLNAGSGIWGVFVLSLEHHIENRSASSLNHD